jgi:hypothetical protein
VTNAIQYHCHCHCRSHLVKVSAAGIGESKGPHVDVYLKSRQPQAAYGVYTGRVNDSNSEGKQTIGYSPVMCDQTKERAELMAINRALRRTLAVI